MEYFKIVLTSLFSLFALFVLTKMTGNKQMSELTMFDYIIGISIGSIAAEMATELEKPIFPLIAMVIYAVVAFGISIACSKSIRVRRLIFGKSIILMKNGKIFRKGLKKGRLDLNEFLVQCRLNGFFDLSAVNMAVLEPSGKISFLPFPDKRPLTAADTKTVPQKDEYFTNVIMDGKIYDKNLKAAGKDINWLENELSSRGVKTAEIFLATLSTDGILNIFKNNDFVQDNDIFE